MAKALCDSHEIANLSARCGGERGSRLMSCTTYPTLMVCSKHPDIPWMSGGPWAAKLAQRSTDEWPQCRAKGLARVACLLREAGENTPLCGGQKPLWLDRLSAQSGLVGCRSDGNTRKTGLGGCLCCRGVQPNGRFASSPGPSPLVFAPSWLVLLGARQAEMRCAGRGVGHASAALACLRLLASRETQFAMRGACGGTCPPDGVGMGLRCLPDAQAAPTHAQERP